MDSTSCHRAYRFEEKVRLLKIWENFFDKKIQESDLMSRLAAAGKLQNYDAWFENFLPQLFDSDFILEPGNFLNILLIFFICLDKIQNFFRHC